MTTNPLNSQFAAGAAGTPLSQSSGTEVENAQHRDAVQQRQVQTEMKTEAAAGIGETDTDDPRAGDRDPSGQLPWRWVQHPENRDDEKESHKSADPDGETGTRIDLMG